MKIAFMVNLFPRLSETFILNQITGLINRGHDVDIYAYGPENERQVHADIAKYKLLEHTFYYGHLMPENKFLRLIKAIVLIISKYNNNSRSLLRSLNIFKFGREAASLGMFYKSILFLNKGPYEIIHCHFGPNGNLGVLLRDMGVIKGKVVTSFHGYDMSSYVKSHGNAVYDYLFLKGDLFLPISEKWKDELIKLGCDGEKIIVHRMGVDTNKFRYSPHKPKNDCKARILTVARLVKKKGVQYGIQAVARVLKKLPGVEYKIVGDGPLRDTLEHLIKELNIDNKIRLLGWKQQEEIIELMQEADILIAPSVTSEDGDQEGIPVVLMEAMAQGIPVISTNHSGIPELVQNGESGFLVPERDVGALADRIEYFIEHQELWAEMGQRGRKYVEENYDINKLNDRLIEIYQKLLK